MKICVILKPSLFKALTQFDLFGNQKQKAAFLEQIKGKAMRKSKTHGKPLRNTENLCSFFFGAFLKSLTKI